MNILTVTEQVVADLSSALKKVERLPLNHNRLETQKAILDASILALSIVDRDFVGERVEDGLSVDEISEKMFRKGKADQSSGTSSRADEETRSDTLISVTCVLHGKIVAYKLKGATEDEVAGLSKLVLEAKILEAAFEGKDPSHVPVIEFIRKGEHNFELSVALDDGSRANVEADAVPEDTDEAAYWAAKDAAAENAALSIVNSVGEPSVVFTGLGKGEKIISVDELRDFAIKHFGKGVKVIFQSPFVRKSS